jgi:hypothetical protein
MINRFARLACNRKRERGSCSASAQVERSCHATGVRIDPSAARHARRVLSTPRKERELGRPSTDAMARKVERFGLEEPKKPNTMRMLRHATAEINRRETKETTY